MTHTLRINGKDTDFTDDSAPRTIHQLLDVLSINNATVVAEIDGLIVERKDFKTTNVKPGQSIELVRFIGGG